MDIQTMSDDALIALADDIRRVLARRRWEEAEREAAERAAREERSKREALEAAAAKEKADAEEKKRQAELAPDKEKIVALADAIMSMEMPSVASPDAAAVVKWCKSELIRLSGAVRVKANTL